MYLHHLGIATNNLKKTEKFVLGTHNVISKKGPIYDQKLNATLTLFETSNGTNIELVQGLAVENFLRKKITLYHSCYEVDNIHEKIEVFLKEGSFLIVNPVPAILFEQRLVCFLMTPLGIVQLLNKKNL